MPPVSSEPSITFTQQPRVVTVHNVLDSELDTLRNASPGTYFGFFGLCLGAAIAFGSVILSQKPSDPNHTTFIALFWPSLVLTALFGVLGVRAHNASKDLVDQIRRRPPVQ